jgi:hypothetical protein
MDLNRSTKKMKHRRLTRVVRKTRQRKTMRKRRQQKHRKQGGGYASISNAFPVTTWGSNWSSLPGSTLWGPGQQAPLPLANGGLYTAPQSTGAWASQPMPATQYAFAAEAAKIANNPEVFYQQRPITQPGTSWSPWVGQTISQDHWSARLPRGVSDISK